MGGMVKGRTVGLQSQLGNWAARFVTTGIVGAAGLTGSTVAPTNVFASTPDPITAPATTPFQSNPTRASINLSVVPSDIVQQAMQHGVARGPFIFRTKGVNDEHSFFAPIQHPGRIMDRVVEGLNVVGIQTERATGETYDWLKPLTAALLLAGISTILMGDYSKRPLIGGRTTLGESIGLTGAAGMLLMVSWVYTFPYTASAILRDGFVPSSFRFNYGASTANFLVMGMWAFLGAWSLVSSLTFRLPGPAFQHLFVRGRTQHAPFILAGGKFQDASANTVKALLDSRGGKLAFSIEASHLQRPNVIAAAQQLGAAPVTVKLSVSHDEFLTLRPVIKQLPAQVTVTTVENARKGAVITSQSFAQPHQSTVLVAGSRLRDHSSLQGWVDQGRAYWQQLRGGASGRVLVLKQDVALSELPAAGASIVSGVFKHSREYQGIPPKLSKNGTYAVQFTGPANTLLPSVAEAIAGRPFVSGMGLRALFFSPFHLTPTPVRSALHRVMWPTTITVELGDPQSNDPAAYTALATIAGQTRYVVQPKTPLVAISRAVVESVVTEQQKNGVADPQQVTLTMERKDWERLNAVQIAVLGAPAFGQFLTNAVAVPSADYPSMVTFSVESGALIQALAEPTSDLYTLARQGKVQLVVPAPLCTPSDVVRLSPHENIAVKVAAGDQTSLDDLLYPKEEGTSVPWWRVLGGSVNQGWRFGRLPAMAAITLTGGLSAPINVTTKLLSGYTDPTTWITSGLRVFPIGFVNMLTTPVIRGIVNPQRFNNYLAFLPGLLAISVAYEPLNDVANNEPPKMWARSLMEDISHEDRGVERLKQLADLQREEASITEAKGREFILNYRLGNFLATGYYSADDVFHLRKVYDKLLEEDPQARNRFLAGMMDDPGFVYLVQQDRTAHAFFTQEIQRHSDGIRAVLQTERPNVNSAKTFSRFLEAR